MTRRPLYSIKSGIAWLGAPRGLRLSRRKETISTMKEGMDTILKGHNAGGASPSPTRKREGQRTGMAPPPGELSAKRTEGGKVSGYQSFQAKRKPTAQRTVGLRQTIQDSNLRRPAAKRPASPPYPCGKAALNVLRTRSQVRAYDSNAKRKPTAQRTVGLWWTIQDSNL